jgi:hypothetical protein
MPSKAFEDALSEYEAGPETFKDAVKVLYRGILNFAFAFLVVCFIMVFVMIVIFFVISMITCIPFPLWVEFFKTGIEPSEPEFSLSVLFSVIWIDLKFLVTQKILIPYYILFSAAVIILIKTEDQQNKNKIE